MDFTRKKLTSRLHCGSLHQNDESYHSVADTSISSNIILTREIRNVSILIMNMSRERLANLFSLLKRWFHYLI